MEKEISIEDITTFISQKLMRLRKEKGYTSHETFAYDHEFARMQYWRIEKGKTTPTIKTLVRLLNIHEVSISDFFKDFNIDD